MLKALLSIISVLVSVSALADEHSKVYYVGEQQVGIAGDMMSCFVEVDYKEETPQAVVRTLVVDSHETDSLFSLGPIMATYTETVPGYVFSDASVNAQVIQFLLLAPSVTQPEKMSVSYLHVNHPHSIACDQLSELSGADLIHAQELFSHFGDHDEDHDESEDHSESGPHDEHGDDHEHEYGHE